MDIHLAGSRPTRRAPPEYFTGTVLQDPIITATAPARLVCNRVSFEPGARTAWHTHPLGQTLHVVSGIGRVQLWGGPIREIRPGDTSNRRLNSLVRSFEAITLMMRRSRGVRVLSHAGKSILNAA